MRKKCYEIHCLGTFNPLDPLINFFPDGPLTAQKS